MHLFTSGSPFKTTCLNLAPIIYEQTNKNFKKTKHKISKFINNTSFIDRIVKRAEQNKGQHDQSYFLGAFSLLSNRKDIDFAQLMYGKLLPSELNRVERINRKFGLKIPGFLNDYRVYPINRSI